MLLFCIVNSPKTTIQILLKRAEQEWSILIVFYYVLYHVRAISYRCLPFALHKSGTRLLLNCIFIQDEQGNYLSVKLYCTANLMIAE